MNENDLITHVLTKMYNFEKSPEGIDVAETDDAANDTGYISNDEEGPPMGWAFRGFAAFIVFGPFAGEKRHQINLLKMGNDDGPDKESRKGAREKERLAADAVRQRDEDGNRGVPLGATKKDMVLIAQADESTSLRQQELSMFAISKLISSKTELLKTNVDLLKMLSDTGQDAEVRADIASDRAEIKSLHDRLEEMSNKKRDRSTVVENFINQSDVFGPPLKKSTNTNAADGSNIE